MSNTTKRLPLARAAQLAAAIKAELEPDCARIEVAGSVRRRKPDVGDLELVAIPWALTDLYGAPVGSRLDPVLAGLVESGRLRPIMGGDRYKQFVLDWLEEMRMPVKRNLK